MSNHIHLDHPVNPDGLIRAYVHLLRTQGAPGVRLVDGEGRVYLKACNAKRKGRKTPCRSKKRHPTKEGNYVCGHCGARWRYYDRLLLKGSVQVSPKIGAIENCLVNDATVGVLFDRFMKSKKFYWAARVYVLKIVEGVGDKHLARIGRKRIPESPHRWTEYQVRQLVNLARAEWRTRLLAAGIRLS